MKGPTFDKVINILRQHKGLTEDEARILVKIIQKGIVNANDISKIIDNLKLSNSPSRPYQVLKSLEGKEVLFEIHNSKIKQYKPIHPRHLLGQLKQDWKKLDEEINILEQARETVDFDKVDVRKKCMVIGSEDYLITQLSEFDRGGFDINIVLYEDITSKNFIKKIEILGEHLKLKLDHGKVNLILLTNKRTEEYGVIILSKWVNKTGITSFFGNLTMGKELYDYFKKGGIDSG